MSQATWSLASNRLCCEGEESSYAGVGWRSTRRDPPSRRIASTAGFTDGRARRSPQKGPWMFLRAVVSWRRHRRHQPGRPRVTSRPPSREMTTGPSQPRPDHAARHIAPSTPGPADRMQYRSSHASRSPICTKP
ncbi:hypothetical protein KUTG_10004 [Kutzneria sp. 744]|nr:hypothetical protein KUTG_10004 [Kutzneria sp. 744]